MYINWSQFLMQCVALTGWIFLVAAVYAIAENMVRDRTAGTSDNQKRAGGESSGG